MYISEILQEHGIQSADLRQKVDSYTAYLTRDARLRMANSVLTIQTPQGSLDVIIIDGFIESISPDQNSHTSFDFNERGKLTGITLSVSPKTSTTRTRSQKTVTRKTALSAKNHNTLLVQTLVKTVAVYLWLHTVLKESTLLRTTRPRWTTILRLLQLEFSRTESSKNENQTLIYS